MPTQRLGVSESKYLSIIAMENVSLSLAPMAFEH